MHDKLALNRETLRTLTRLDMAGIAGGQTGTICSNPSDTCDTCFGPSCASAPTTANGTSACC
jgi:hypothetical protein